MQLFQTVSLIDPLTRHIDRGRPAHIDRKAGQAGAQIGLDNLALREIGVPNFLRVHRRLLAQCQKSDLAATILDPIAPGSLLHETRRRQRCIERLQYRLLLLVVEQFCIGRAPTTSLVVVKLRPRGRHEPKSQEVGMDRKPARNLFVELRPVATRYHGNVRDSQKIRKRLGYPVGTRMLGFGKGSVEIEGYKLLHWMEACKEGSTRSPGPIHRLIATAHHSGCSGRGSIGRRARRDQDSLCPTAKERDAHSHRMAHSPINRVFPTFVPWSYGARGWNTKLDIEPMYISLWQWQSEDPPRFAARAFIEG